MNKSIALLLIGVISLAMVLIMLNQGTTTTPQPPLLGVQNPLPQTGMPTTPALQTPASPPPASAPVQQKSSTSVQAAAAVPQSPSPTSQLHQQNSPPPASVQTPAAPKGASTEPLTTENTQIARANPERAAQSASSTPAVKEKTAPPVEKKPTPPPAPPKAAEPKAINRITVSAAGEGATVRIAGNATLAYKTMHLKSPDRVVVDLEGVWAIKAPGVPANKAVTNVRIGKQPDKTRIVIDLSNPNATVNFIKVTGETLDVRIK